MSRFGLGNDACSGIWRMLDMSDGSNGESRCGKNTEKLID